MSENEIAKIAIDASMKIHKILGPELLESVYETILAYELNKSGIDTQRQVSIPVEYEKLNFSEGYRADLLLDDKVIIELKSINKIEPIHFKQLLTYLKLANKKLRLLINFNEILLKNGIKRIVNKLDE